jgi:hypothetical protein
VPRDGIITVLGLVRDLDKNVPFDKITVDMLKNMYYGEDINLNDTFTLSKHSEEDMFDIYHTETWSNLYGISWDWDTDEDDSIEFEQVYHNEETYRRDY